MPITQANDQAAAWPWMGRQPWLALALAALVLLPFLGKAYTIDDPVFLGEAQQLLVDALHPSAFEIVWNSERRLRASAFLPGGPLAGYVLVPLAIAHWQEWAGHLLMFLYFALAIVGTTALARRLGLSSWAQQAAGLLTASAPAALGMAGTLMPDIPATMFGVLGMERFVAWTQDRRPRTGISAACLLAFAVLTRINLLVLLAIGGLYGLRRSWRAGWPVVLAVGLALVGFVVTRDPDPMGGTAASAARWQLRFDRSVYHSSLFSAPISPPRRCSRPSSAASGSRRLGCFGSGCWCRCPSSPTSISPRSTCSPRSRPPPSSLSS